MRVGEHRKKHGAAVWLTVLLVLMFVPTLASAAAPNNLGVSPAVSNIDILPSQSTVTFTNTVINDSDQTMVVRATTSDFTVSGNGGSVVFETPHNSAYSLKESLSISEPTFTLAPHQSRVVTIAIVNAQALKAGGHYAAVLYNTVLQPTAKSRTPTVNLKQTVASLVLATTAGKGTVDLRLLPIDHPIALFKLPSTYNLSFQNQGNVQAIPRGAVRITGPLNKQYSKGQINSESAMVLPETTRLFETSVSRVMHAWIPGKYTIHVAYRAASSTKITEKTQSFWYINFGSFLCILFLFNWAWQARHRNRRRYHKLKTRLVKSKKTAKL